MWEMSDMADGGDLKGRELYDALLKLKPEDLTPTEWAIQAGLNRGFLTNLKSSSGSVRSDNLRKLLRHVGRTEGDLYAVAAGVTLAEPDLPPARSTDANETVEVIQLDLSLPMGPGASVDDYIEEEPRTFDLAYLRGFTRAPPHRLRLARGVGDSMFPTLQSADAVWIDSTQRTLNLSDKVWAVSINGGAAIKRLRPLKGDRVLIISDNPTIGNYEVDADELLIGGRVIRFERDL